MQHYSSNATLLALPCIILWQVLLLINEHLAWQILSFKRLYLPLHNRLVLLYGWFNLTLDQVHIALPALHSHLCLHQLNQPLHQQILQQLLVQPLVLDLLHHPAPAVLVQLLNQPIHCLHLLNPLRILLRTLLYPQLYLILLKLRLVILNYYLLLLRKGNDR